MNITNNEEGRGRSRGRRGTRGVRTGAARPKRARVLPVPVARNTRSESFWSSLDLIAVNPSSSDVLRPSSPMETSPLRPPTPPSLPGTSGQAGPELTNPPVDLPVGEARGDRRPCLASSSRVQQRPLSDAQIQHLNNYGSEEEEENSEGEELGTPRVPRSARIFLEPEDDEVVDEGCINICLEWPPPLTRTSLTPISPPPVAPTPSVATLPNDKFCFDWRAIPQPQIDPLLRRETFSHINVGATVSVTHPYEAFTAIWDRKIMEMIARETNIYAQQLASTMLEDGTIRPKSRITQWQDTSVNELFVYFAIVLAMGLVVKTRIEEYWNVSRDIFSTPGFSVYMTFDRFQLLSKCLHFANNLHCDTALLTRSQAKLYKIQPILDHLNLKFSSLYNLSQNIALDESLTMWKGWLDINQFIRNKAATVGIKTYEVCESHTGYLWRFEVHAGQASGVQHDPDPVSGKVPALVLRLLNGLEHRGHTIWMDNFYNSPALARELKTRGFDCVGTLRTNRQFVPAELAGITKRDMTVGQVFGCTSGDVDLMVWRDRNRVAIISTYHGIALTRCGDKFKPTVVAEYNIRMGGVDRKDQQLAMYPVERRRTSVWYKKLFKRLLNASVLNSYILLNNPSLTHRKFRKVLITDLLAAHKTPSPTSSNINVSHLHPLGQYQKVSTGTSDRQKRTCVVCKKRTGTFCKKCQVPMCVFTCYEPFHLTPALYKHYKH